MRHMRIDGRRCGGRLSSAAQNIDTGINQKTLDSPAMPPLAMMTMLSAKKFISFDAN
jgi:hypothetical protein